MKVFYSSVTRLFAKSGLYQCHHCLHLLWLGSMHKVSDGDVVNLVILKPFYLKECHHRLWSKSIDVMVGSF